jgi:hypothetical protein
VKFYGCGNNVVNCLSRKVYTVVVVSHDGAPVRHEPGQPINGIKAGKSMADTASISLGWLVISYFLLASLACDFVLTTGLYGRATYLLIMDQ